MDAAPNGSLLHAENAGDLSDRESDEILEHDGHAALIRKSGDFLLKPCDRLCSNLSLQGVGLILCNNRNEPIAEGQKCIQRPDMLRLVGLLAVHPLGRVRRDPEEPRLRIGVAAKLAPGPERLKKDLVNEILCLLAVATEPGRKALELPTELINDPLNLGFCGFVNRVFVGIAHGCPPPRVSPFRQDSESLFAFMLLAKREASASRVGSSNKLMIFR